MTPAKLPPRLPDFARLLGELPARALLRPRLLDEAQGEPSTPSPAAPAARTTRRTDPLLHRLLRLLRGSGEK